MDEFRVVLVGKTGMGKSSVGNSLLETAPFKSAESGAAMTQKVEPCECKKKVYGKTINLKVYDTPGIFDSSRPISEIMKLILDFVIQSDPGPHIFLFVMKMERISEESIKTIELFKDNLGKDVLKYTIIIFTCKDHIKQSQGNWFENTFKDIPKLSTFIESCNMRYKSINNEGNTKKQDADGILELIHRTIMENRKNNCEFYTNAMCETAKQFYQQKQETEIREKKEEFRREVESEIRDKIRKEEIIKIRKEERIKIRKEERIKIRKEERIKIRKEERIKIRKEERIKIRKEERIKIRKEERIKMRKEDRIKIRKEDRGKTLEELLVDVKTGEEENKKEEKELESNRTSNITDNANKDQSDPMTGKRGRVRGPIKEPDKTILREKIPSLIKKLKYPKLLIPSLIARDVFDDDDKEKVEREIRDNGNKAGMTKLLEILKDCGSDALQLFMECLNDNNCIPALELLESAIKLESDQSSKVTDVGEDKADPTPELKQNQSQDVVDTGEDGEPVSKKHKLEADVTQGNSTKENQMHLEGGADTLYHRVV